MTAPFVLPPGWAFLFDMDGVIIDSMAMHTESWIRYIAKQGWAAEQIAERMLGKRNDQILRDFLGDQLTDAEVFAHGAAKEALYRELMAPVFDAHLVPGVREFLEATQGSLRGMGTNAEPDNVRFVLDRAGLRHHFAAIVDGHQVVNAKPAPDVYLEAASRLGVSPERTIVFEDSHGGIAAARAAGAKVVCIETTLKDHSDVDLSIADFTDPRLAAWLRSAVVLQ